MHGIFMFPRDEFEDFVFFCVPPTIGQLHIHSYLVSNKLVGDLYAALWTANSEMAVTTIINYIT